MEKIVEKIIEKEVIKEVPIEVKKQINPTTETSMYIPPTTPTEKKPKPPRYQGWGPPGGAR